MNRKQLVSGLLGTAVTLVLGLGPVSADFTPTFATADASPAVLVAAVTRNYQAISLTNVQDQDGNPLVFDNVTAICQDETPNSVGNPSNPLISATGVGTTTPKVRRERSNAGDGRVYHIFFTAHNANNDSFAGEATTEVRLANPGVPAVDGGALYDSTVTATTGCPAV